MEESQTLSLAAEQLGKYVIVQTYSTVVHFGTLVAVNDREVKLIKARRLWYWEGALTLSAVALNGINSGKLSASLPELYLTEPIEIIPCSETAATQLKRICRSAGVTYLRFHAIRHHVASLLAELTRLVCLPSNKYLSMLIRQQLNYMYRD